MQKVQLWIAAHAAEMRCMRDSCELVVVRNCLLLVDTLINSPNNFLDTCGLQNTLSSLPLNIFVSLIMVYVIYFRCIDSHSLTHYAVFHG